MELRPGSRIRQGDPLSPLLFDVITILLVFDLERLPVEVLVLLYANDRLLCLPGRGPKNVADLCTVLYVLQVFAYFLGLRGNVCPARARRATFLSTIPTSAPDLPSDGEGPPNRP